MFRRLSLVLLLLTLVVALPRAAHASTPPTWAPLVYVEDPAGGLSRTIQMAGQGVILTDAAEAGTLIFDGSISDPERFGALIRGGKHAVVILGPSVTTDVLSRFLGEPVELTARSDPLSLNVASGAGGRLANGIAWNSAPQVRERYEVTSPALEPIITGYGSDEVLIGSRQVGLGSVLLVTPVLDGRANSALQEWAYANYLGYVLLGYPFWNDLLTFAQYPGAPVPHEAERRLLLVALGMCLVTASTLFVIVRRYSLRHPEALDALVAERSRYIKRQEATDWDDIGFHRPLAGYLVAFFLGLLLFVPLIVYQNLILPSYILPSAQALGIWGRVTQFFNVAWLFFDLGASAAFVKYLAEYRVSDPRRGFMYGQLFVWWQVLSGGVQVALIVLIASSVLPSSTYAVYSWSVIVHAFVQLPGFFLVYRHSLLGLQRFDYAQLVDVVQTIVPALAQIPFVLIAVRWGRGHPAFGPAMGGLLGMGLAAYAGELICFGFGHLLYRRLGLRGRVLFMAHFDWRVVTSAFRFGVFEMLGSLAWAAGQAAEVALTQNRLVNYAETWGNWVIAQNFVFGFNVINVLFYNLIASISEAYAHGRRALSEYYAAQAYRYGGLFSAFITAVLLAVADRFILGATGPEFARAAVYVTPLILWGALQYPSWVSDAVQLGSNRPYLKTAMVAGEQVLRIGLAALLLARFQVAALIIAYFAGLVAKDVVSFIVNDRVCFRQRLYAWPALVAPLLAGAVHYLILRAVTGLIWTGDQVSSLLIFFLGILPSLPVFAFLYGFFGGWDEASLREVSRAAALSGAVKPLAQLFVSSSALGDRLSPWRGYARMPVRTRAEVEALALSAARVELDGSG